MSRPLSETAAPHSILRLHCCADCPAPVFTRALRCDDCKRNRALAQKRAYQKSYAQKYPERVKASRRQFFKTDKGRACRRRDKTRRPEWKAANRDRQNAHNRAYRLRLARDGIQRRVASGAVIYFRVQTAHIRAWRKWKRIAKAAPRIEPPRSYPYVAQVSPRSADLLAINALVPRGVAGREDICQSIMLAIIEGKTTVAAMSKRGAVAKFCTAHHRDNFEARGYAISLNESRRDGRQWADVLAAAPC